MQTISATVGNVTSNDQAIAASQNVVSAGSLTLTSSSVSFAYPSQIIITTSADFSAITFTIVGLDANGVSCTETTLGPNTTTKLLTNYFTKITSVSTDGGVGGGAVAVGVTGITSSRWMFLDSWTTGTISVQCAVSGTINYTVQSTLDNPADPHNSVSSVNVNWFDSNDSAVVGAISSQQSNFQYAPAYVRVIKNTGTGSVNTTLLQTGVTNL